MKDATLDQVEELLKIAVDLYALSSTQREAVARYRAAIDEARSSRKEKEEEKKEKSKLQEQQEQLHQQQLKKKNGKNKKKKKQEMPVTLAPTRPVQERPVSVDLPEVGVSRESELRAARQAELFARHDIAREEAKANLCHHPLRVSGQPLIAEDSSTVVFASLSILRMGQLVAVPRSQGGLFYAQLVAVVPSQKCFFNPRIQHSRAENLVKVQCGDIYKTLPPPMLGQLLLAPGRSLGAILEPIVSAIEPTPLVGDRVISHDAASMKLFPGSNFAPGELVAVPRSFGGFTIGRIVGPRTAPCHIDGHPVPVWRIITDEADDESEARTKTIRAGLVGKLSSSWATLGVQTVGILDESNVEQKLRERFGDFTPFLDDDDSNDLVPLGDLEANIKFDPLEASQTPSDEGKNPWKAFSEPLFG